MSLIIKFDTHYKSLQIKIICRYILYFKFPTMYNDCREIRANHSVIDNITKPF